MKGFLYKELLQNKLRLLLTVLIALCTVFLPLILILLDGEDASNGVLYTLATDGGLLRGIVIILGVIASWITIQWIPSGDRTKKWCYFTASTPSGIGGFIYSKYIFMALQSAMYFVLCIGFSYLLRFIGDCTGGYDIPTFTKLFVTLFFVQLVSIAVDFPFSVRFGEKAGSILKLVMYLSLGAVALLLFIKSPDRVSRFIEKFVKKILSGGFPSYFKFILAFGAILVYTLSGVISRFLYLKGIEKHSK